MTTDRSIRSIRAALQAGDAADARRVFLGLLALGTDFAELLDAVLHDPYSHGSLSIHACIAFLEALENAEWALAGCAALHRVHAEQQASSPFADVPVFRLARFVEDILATLGANDTARPRAEMRSKEWFSPTVRAIVRGEKIRIESFLHREVLYAPAGNWKFDATRRLAFTWRSEWFEDGAQSEQFLAEPVDVTWTRFALRSVPYNEYLVAERVDDQNDPRHESRLRVFCVRGDALANVRAQGTWMLRSQDGTTNRDVFDVYNAHADEHLQAPSDFVCDSTRRYVATESTRGEDGTHSELAQTSQWCIVPLQPPTPFEQAIEAFLQAKYAEAERCLLTIPKQSVVRDTRFRSCVFLLASRLRGGQTVVNEVEFEALEALDGARAAARLGIEGLWAEIAGVVDDQRRQDPANNSRGYVERKMRQANRLVAAHDYPSALEMFIEIAQVAERSVEHVDDADDREALERIRGRSRVDCAKMLFSLGRTADALAELEDLQRTTTLPKEIAARALLWTAKCKRQGNCA